MAMRIEVGGLSRELMRLSNIVSEAQESRKGAVSVFSVRTRRPEKPSMDSSSEASKSRSENFIRFSNGSDGQTQETGTNTVRSRDLTELNPFGVQINACVCAINREVPARRWWASKVVTSWT